MAVTDCRTFIATRYLIFGQLLVFLPLAMIRNLAKLSGTALVADLFIVIGRTSSPSRRLIANTVVVVYIGGNEGRVLATKGLADVQLFNRDNFPLLIGTAVFAFEGIGLYAAPSTALSPADGRRVIPLTESMREPQKFPRVLSGVMLVVAVLFAGFGAMGYAAYGSDIQTVVIVNLPQDDKFVQVVQLICASIFPSPPFFPKQCARDGAEPCSLQTRLRSYFRCHFSFSPPSGSWRTVSSPGRGNTTRRSSGRRTSFVPGRCCSVP